MVKHTLVDRFTVYRALSKTLSSGSLQIIYPLLQGIGRPEVVCD